VSAQSSSSTEMQTLPNGPGSAALLAAGIGALMLAILAIAGDKVLWFKSMMIFSKPTGPLSGVTTCAIAAWLIAWWILDRRWRRRSVSSRVSVVALVLLWLGFLLTFPPIADLF